MPLVGGLGGQPTRNLRVQLTRFQPRGVADYAHHITDCPPGFENLMASLYQGRYVLHVEKTQGFGMLQVSHLDVNSNCNTNKNEKDFVLDCELNLPTKTS